MSKAKQKSKPISKRILPNPEARNAFKLLQRAAKLNEAQMTGDLTKMPITITSSDEADETHQLDTHTELVEYVIDLLVELGFSPEGALNVISSSKATKDVMRNMFVK